MKTVQLVLETFTVLGLGIVFVQLRINRKQLYLETVRYCIEKFKKINPYNDMDNTKIKEYLDFCNEEFFYIKKGYLPTDISGEWINGMIDFMPIIKGDTILNKKYLHHGKHDEILLSLSNYQRIRQSFTIKGSYDWSSIYSESDDPDIKYSERKKLIKEIRNNLKNVKEYK